MPLVLRDRQATVAFIGKTSLDVKVATGGRSFRRRLAWKHPLHLERRTTSTRRTQRELQEDAEEKQRIEGGRRIIPPGMPLYPAGCSPNQFAVAIGSCRSQLLFAVAVRSPPRPRGCSSSASSALMLSSALRPKDPSKPNEASPGGPSSRPSRQPCSPLRIRAGVSSGAGAGSPRPSTSPGGTGPFSFISSDPSRSARNIPSATSPRPVSSMTASSS